MKRRAALGTLGGALGIVSKAAITGAALGGLPVRVFAQGAPRDKTFAIPDLRPIREFINNRPVQRTRVFIDIASQADNGNSVPAVLNVESPMTETDHVKRMVLFSDKNPYAQMAHFTLGPFSGKASIATRLRLGGSQHLTLFAEMADNSLYADVVEVTVTVSACIDAA